MWDECSVRCKNISGSRIKLRFERGRLHRIDVCAERIRKKEQVQCTTAIWRLRQQYPGPYFETEEDFHSCMG